MLSMPATLSGKLLLPATLSGKPLLPATLSRKPLLPATLSGKLLNPKRRQSAGRYTTRKLFTAGTPVTGKHRNGTEAF